MIRRVLLMAAALCLPLLALAQDVKYEKYTLPNGMKVILHEDHSLPVATVNIWYYVGSKDEPPRRSGFAHLFEHLMFMGTERVPTGQYDQIMEGGGGYNNASTAQDRTNYYDYGPSSLLPTLLWLEADRLEDLGRMMDQKKVDLQREVVKNERRESYENQPYGLAIERIYSAMYPEGHPYHVVPIGTMEDINQASVQDVKDFFAKFYVPNNASMVVAGDFDPKAIKPLIAKLFGTLPRIEDPSHRAAPSPQLSEVKRMTMPDNVQYPRTYMVWHSPAYYKPGDADMDLAAAVLSNGFTSRLYQRLVVKDELATDVEASQNSQYLGSLFIISATAKPGVSLDKIESAIDEVVAEFLKSGPTRDELDRQSHRIEFATISGLQSLADRADRLNEYEFYYGEPNSFKRALDRYRNANPAEVLQWSKKVLDLNARLIFRVVPQNEKPATNPRNERPAAASESAFALPTPASFTLSNGVKVFYFSRPQLPIMQVEAFFPRGAGSDSPGKAGEAQLLMSMLERGAAGLSASEFTQQIEELGASIRPGAGKLDTQVGLYSLTANFDKALKLYADAIIRPNLSAADFEREKGLHIDSITQDAEDPGTVARQVAMREFFGPTNPLGIPENGTPETVKAITVADVKREHDALMRPGLLTLFAAGSMSVEDVKKSLEKEFGTWRDPAGVPALAEPTVAAPANKSLRVVIVDKPEAVQTVVRFVFPGVAYGSPNRVALDALGTVLGGSFTSRLNQNLRENKGYTYGASSSYTFQPTFGYMTAGADVRADVTGASLKEFMSEFNKIRAGDVSESEMAKARSSLRTNTINGLGDLGGLLQTAIFLYRNNRPFSDLSKDLTAIGGLAAGGINPLAKEGVPLEKAILVLVGDKTAILKQIEGLGLPKPEIVKGL